jgi:hypothetical protein
MTQVNVLLDDLETATNALRYRAGLLLNTEPIDKEVKDWAEEKGQHWLEIAKRLQEEIIRAKEEN